MTNDATRARGEAMPAMSRRTALATTGAALAAALTGVAASAAAPAASSLAGKIHQFHAAKAAWDAVADDDCVGPEWDAVEAAEHEVIIYPCATLKDVRLKADFFLNNGMPYDTIRNCSTATEEALLPFLRSLLGVVVEG